MKSKVFSLSLYYHQNITIMNLKEIKELADHLNDPLTQALFKKMRMKEGERVSEDFPFRHYGYINEGEELATFRRVRNCPVAKKEKRYQLPIPKYSKVIFKYGYKTKTVSGHEYMVACVTFKGNEYHVETDNLFMISQMDKIFKDNKPKIK